MLHNRGQAEQNFALQSVAQTVSFLKTLSVARCETR